MNRPSDEDNPPDFHRGWGHGTCGGSPKRLPTSRFEGVHRDGIVLAGQSGAPGTGHAHWPESGLEARLRIPTPGSPATHRFKQVHMLPLISRSKPVSVFGPEPSHSEYGPVIRCRSMTRYPIRQRECCRVIEENHSE